MRSWADVVHYYREFLALNKLLLDSQHLIPGTRNKIFWCKFHKKDRAEMYAGFVAEHPRQFVDVHFDYLDIHEVARVIFSGHILDTSIESDDSSDEPRSARIRRSERIQEHWYERKDSDLCRGYSTSWTQDHRRPSPPISYKPHHSRYQHSDIHFMPLPETGPRVVRFKESAREEEECEAEKNFDQYQNLYKYYLYQYNKD